MTRSLIGLGSIALIALKDKKNKRTQQQVIIQQQRLLTPQQYTSLPVQQRLGKTVSWGSRNALYSLEVETWLGDWDGWSEELAKTHPNLKLVHHQDTDDVSRGVIIGPIEDLWAFETEHMHIDNIRDPKYRKHFEKRLKEIT